MLPASLAYGIGVRHNAETLANRSNQLGTVRTQWLLNSSKSSYGVKKGRLRLS